MVQMDSTAIYKYAHHDNACPHGPRDQFLVSLRTLATADGDYEFTHSYY